MSFEIPIDSYDPDKFGQRPPNGKMHLQITRVDEEGGRQGEMLVDFEVLTSDPAGNEGFGWTEKYKKESKLFFLMLNLAIAAKLTSHEELKKLKAAGKNPVIAWEDLVGRQICGIVEDSEKDGVKNPVYHRFGSVFAPDDPKVKYWPKHAAMLQRAGFDPAKCIQTPPANNAGGGAAGGNGAVKGQGPADTKGTNEYRQPAGAAQQQKNSQVPAAADVFDGLEV
jgi:hypothetical protein